MEILEIAKKPTLTVASAMHHIGFSLTESTLNPLFLPHRNECDLEQTKGGSMWLTVDNTILCIINTIIASPTCLINTHMIIC